MWRQAKEGLQVADREKLRKVIESVLRERFDNVEIETVSIESDFDEDGDAILRVKVIFDGEKKQLDARIASGVLRHMRPKMAEIGEEAFPVISYIAKSEIEDKKPAAA